MEQYLTIGIVLGLSAGFAPGPLLASVISETLRHDIRSGIKVALAPIITDFPILVISIFILSKLASYESALGCISLVGSIFVFFMAYQAISTCGNEVDYKEVSPKSLQKGVLVNALSPHPYIFWFSIGAPTVTKAMIQNIYFPLVFILSFYILLVGSKILLAVLVGKSKVFMQGKVYIFTQRFLGTLLAGFAIILFRDGLELLGII